MKSTLSEHPFESQSHQVSHVLSGVCMDIFGNAINCEGMENFGHIRLPGNPLWHRVCYNVIYVNNSHKLINYKIDSFRT
jgi:hypothetical protein